MTIEEWAKDFKSYVNELDMQRDDYNGIMEYIDDAIALLKEQEAIRPDYELTTLSWSCGNCGQTFDRCKYKYCPNCGQAVKWDD